MSGKIWDHSAIKEIYEQSIITLIHTAQSIHGQHFNQNEVELCTVFSVKTGACPEDCAYCPQSGHYNTNLKKEKLLDIDNVIAQAKQAKANGAIRFCMGAAWRNPPKKEFPKVLEMIKAVKALGLETCVTLGMLTEEQASELFDAGLDFYNHNLDTSPDFYKNIISTRTYEDRLDTLNHVRTSGIKVCCGAIIGMGETREDRIALLAELANLPKAPESIPINRLIPIKGTPLEQVEQIDDLEFIRTIATTRIVMPQSIIRLSAGRSAMSESTQLLCFMSGANSIWLGDKLLTTQNREAYDDKVMLERMGIHDKSQRYHVN